MKDTADSIRVASPMVIAIGALTILVTQGCASTPEGTHGSTTRSADASGGVVEQHISPAGHRYWYYGMPFAERTAVAVTWSAEIPEESQMHVATARVGIDLMLNGGAGGKEPEDIIADFEDLDSGSRLWVQPQEISGFMVAPEEHMERASEIANVVLTEPNLNENWFARELKNLTDNATDRDSIVEGLAWNLAREMSLGDHPYKRFWSLRPVEEIKSISLDNVKSWHAGAFKTAGISITAAGNASAEKVGTEIDRVLQGMTEGTPTAPREFLQPKLPGKTVLLHQPEAPKSIILALGNLPPHSEENDVSVQLGIGVLGHGKQSRLFKAVRSGLRAAYGFGAGQFNMTRSHKLFHISGEVETGKLQEALDETERTYEKFRLGGIGALEFPIAKRFYRQTLNQEFAKPESVAYLMMESERTGKPVDQVANLRDKVGNLKRDEVNQIVKESFPPFGNMLRIIVTPDAEAIQGACVITSIDDWDICS